MIVARIRCALIRYPLQRRLNTWRVVSSAADELCAVAARVIALAACQCTNRATVANRIDRNVRNQLTTELEQVSPTKTEHERDSLHCRRESLTRLHLHWYSELFCSSRTVSARFERRTTPPSSARISLRLARHAASDGHLKRSLDATNPASPL